MMQTYRNRIRRQDGMSLIEASIVLSTIAILTAVMAPSINIYIDQARQARTREDIKTIGDAINEFITDNAEHQFLQVGMGASTEDAPSRTDGDRVDMLVSDGDLPTLSTAITAAGDTIWTQAVNGADIATLSDHLVENGPADDPTFSRYRNPVDVIIATPGDGSTGIDFARTDSSGQNAPYAWRGAYLRGPVRSDAWGNRYAVNVAFLDPSVGSAISGVDATWGPADYPRLDVFVLSAGPDEEIDTPFGQDGAVQYDDDFIYLVSSNAK
jgi:type II secretory pathway pseudopilin PulG